VTHATPAPSTVFDPAAPVPEEYDLFCHACGYSLLGLVGDRCPECGRAVETGGLPYARIPWLHRKRIGFWTAYWRTVRHVVFRPRSFAAEMCRPVRISADDAKRFRRLSSHLAAAAGVLMALAVSWLKGDISRWARQNTDFLPTYILLLIGGYFAGVLFLRLATDMPLFIWKGLPSLPPSELAPLHQYAAAPLGLIPLALVVTVGLPAMAASAGLPDPYLHPVQALAILAAGAWIVALWQTPLVLMKTATGCGNRRVALLALYLPLHWLLMFSMVAMASMVVGIGASYLWEQLDQLRKAGLM
jgi:hypothetical protein